MRLIFIVVFLFSCSQNSVIVAKVNGKAISLGDFRERIQEIELDSRMIPVSDMLEIRRYLLNEMIEEEILRQESKRMGIVVTDQEISQTIYEIFPAHVQADMDQTLKERNSSKKALERTITQNLIAQKVYEKIAETRPIILDRDIETYYQQNTSQFFQQEQVQILQVSVSSQEAAQDLYQQIQKGTPFEDLVARHTANRAHETGYIQKGILPEPLEKWAFSANIGEISGIIESSPDYYIVKLLDKKPAHQRTLDEARQQIQKLLDSEAKQKAYATWLQDKILQSNIKRNEEVLEKIGPL